MGSQHEAGFPSKDIGEEPLRSIVQNVERLIHDARLLLDKGSAGSALSLAILAFEESGKGHVYELDLIKTKRTPSWHHFRQIASAFALLASLYQKYNIATPRVPDDVREAIEARWAGVKNVAEVAKQPIPDALRNMVAGHVAPLLQHLDADQKTIFSVELRWVGKIFKAASCGQIEEQRQRGIYVDLEEHGVASNPLSVTSHDAFYWLRVSERVLRILKHGAYHEPYGELAVALEAMPRSLPTGQDLLDTVSEYLEVFKNRADYGS